MTRRKPTGTAPQRGDIHVRVIADYGPLGDMAFAEVQDRLRHRLAEAGLSLHDYSLDLTSVPKFDTYATGFVLGQLALNSPFGGNHVFYVNTAPRKDKKSARINNEGEGLVYARLKNGVHVIAVNSGYSLTFVKPAALEIRALNVSNAGSQFRSRDIFPLAVKALVAGDSSILGGDVSDTVPSRVPENVVLYTDGYGNMKCAVDPVDLEKLRGKHVYVNVGEKRNVVQVGATIFDVADGEFCFASGSSGWSLPGRKKGLSLRFAEIVKRGGSAAEAFGHPEGGAKVLWKPVPR